MIRSAVLAAGLLALAVSGPAAAQTSLKLGEKFEGVIPGNKTTLNAILPRNAGPGTTKMKGLLRFRDTFLAPVPVVLKAGQAVTVSAAVVGDSRSIQLVLLDSTGHVAGFSKEEARETTLRVEEPPATGRYTLVVMSDLAGKYSLQVTADGQDAPAAAPAPAAGGSPEDRIRQLEAENAELRAKIKELEKTKGKK